VICRPARPSQVHSSPTSELPLLEMKNSKVVLSITAIYHFPDTIITSHLLSAMCLPSNDLFQTTISTSPFMSTLRSPKSTIFPSLTPALFQFPLPPRCLHFPFSQVFLLILFFHFHISFGYIDFLFLLLLLYLIIVVVITILRPLVTL